MLGLFRRKTPEQPLTAMTLPEVTVSASFEDVSFNESAVPEAVRKVEAANLDPFSYIQQQAQSPAYHTLLTGDKFPGGFGATQLFTPDYWTLRQRSAQLFEENLYARGLIRRLVTNEINTGLTPEAFPDEGLTGVPEDDLTDWSETTETRFGIWGKMPGVCHWLNEMTFGEIQRTVRREALVCGDVLVVLRFSRKTGLPLVQLIDGTKVRSPLGVDQDVAKGHRVEHGVETDARGKVVAHWITQEDGTSKRLPAYGSRSGRRLSWLVYGTDKRLDAVRGQPLLTLVLQSLKEIDRYRDAAQRKAVVNSILAMFIEKGEDKQGTLGIQGGAARRDTIETDDGGGPTRSFNVANSVPGLVLEELQHGEKPTVHSTSGADINFPIFEEALLQTIAWCNEIPPEILRLAFSSNYSASQAAINEFRIYLNLVWTQFGEGFCTPVYTEWLISETLNGNVSAPGLLDAWRDPNQYARLGAWLSVDWYGSIKPSTDMHKQMKGSQLLLAEGMSTRARETRITTGMKYSHVAKRLRRENEQHVETMRPLAEFRKEYGAEASETDGPTPAGLTAEEVTDIVASLLPEEKDNDEFLEGFMEALQYAG